MTSEEFRRIEADYYMQVVRRMPPVLVRGEGSQVWDADGKRYLDFTAGWAVLNLGHSHPTVTAAIKEQAGTITQMTNLFYTTPQLDLARLIVDNSCIDRIFFCNSGAEANEGAAKLARKWGKQHLGGAFEIITALNSFHGRTLGMIAATGQPHYQEAWQPLAPGFVSVPYNNIEAIKSATTSNTCAVLLEPLQGEGGVNVPTQNYLYEVQEWCRSRGLLFMLDEVQTGMGRLGSLFGYQRFEGVEPDVITLGKALGSGVPLGAFACKESCSVFQPGDHGSTFGGNALTTAAGAAAAKTIIEDQIAEQAFTTGELLMGKLRALAESTDVISEVRGMGLLIGMQLKSEIAPDVVRQCLDNGLLLNAVRPNTVRFMPPLVVTEAEVDEALTIIGDVLKGFPTSVEHTANSCRLAANK